VGELAWILKQYDEAEIAYRILSDAPDAELNHQIRLFQIIKLQDARMAARVAEQYWLKNGRLDLFMSAAETYATLNDWQAVAHLYKLADEPRWRGYDNNLRFVALRAEMHRNNGEFSAAEHDYRLLALHYPADLTIKEAYLWMLIESYNFSQLDVVMQRWEKLLPAARGLWDVYAAGYLALNRPVKALTLYDHMAKSHAQDELWLLNYANTMQLAGQTKRAAQIRTQIWQKRLNKKTNRDWLHTRANAQDIESLRLLLLNDPGLGQSVLWNLLREGSADLKQNSQFAELAALWLNDHDQNDASRAWLVRQYAHRLVTAP
jgi:polysaccharide biosynthesis protein PelB